MTAGTPSTQTSIWYFLGATFAFASTSLFFTEPGLLWVRIVMLVLGFGLLIVGGFVFGREMNERRAARRDPPGSPPHPDPPEPSR